MSEFRRDGGHRMQLVRLAFYISIAVLSIFYTKAVHMDKHAQSRIAAAGNGGEEENDQSGAGGSYMDGGKRVLLPGRGRQTG